MSRLYDRKVQVLVARPLAGEFFRTGAQITVIEDLKVTFSIEKTLGREPNTCEVTVHNLSEGTRAEFQEKPLKLRLEAGYDGSTSRLFSGDVYWADSKKEGTEWITRALLLDGGRAFKWGRVNRSFNPGVSAKDAVRELANSLGLKLPRNLDALTSLSRQFASGLTLYGTTRDALTALLDRHQLGWSIQDERLQILDAASINTDIPIVASADTGLIGTPDYGPPEKRGGQPVVTVQMLLEPGAHPGGKLEVRSQSVTGDFKMERVLHEGDTHSEAWETTMEGKQL